MGLNPLSPHDALKHHFTSLIKDLIFLQQRVLERKFPFNLFTNTWQFSSIFHPLQVIFIHYKSIIATAIRGLDEDDSGKLRLERLKQERYPTLDWIVKRGCMTNVTMTHDHNNNSFIIHDLQLYCLKSFHMAAMN